MNTLKNYFSFVFVSILVFLNYNITFAQVWGQSASSQGRDIFIDISDISPKNNILTKVEYVDTIVFADTAFYHTVPIYDDNYAISVFDKDGNMKSAIDIVCIPSGYIDKLEVKFDDDENIYISADFTHRVFLLDTAISVVPGPYSYISNIFLLKINSNDKIEWAQVASSTNGIDLKNFVTDEQGNSILEVATTWGGTVNFFDQDSAVYSDDMHGLLKVDKYGKLLWRKEIYSDPTYFFILDIINNNEGNTICYGRAMDDIIYDGDTLNYGDTSIHGYKSFFLEILPNGQLKSFVFSATNIFMFYLTNAPDNDLYFSAPLSYFYDKYYMGKDTIIQNPDTAFSIVGRVDRSFNLKWYQILRKRGSGCPTFALSATSDSVFGAASSGSRLVFNDSIYEFGLRYGTLLTSFGKDGNVGDTKKIRTENDNRIHDIIVDNCNDIILSSKYKGNVYIGDDTLSAYSSYYFDALITKFDRDNNDIINLGNDTSISIYGDINFNIEEGYDEYLWSTGDTTNYINLSGESLGLGDYTVWCKVLNESCTLTDSINISVYDDTGIELTKSKTLLIIPNPASNKISFRTENNVSISNFILYDLKGNILLEGNVKNKSIDISNIESGLYIIRLTTKNGVVSKKLIKK